ncbi:MAG: type III pantothenate kinase [Candidatus Omnitrophota bacterium]|jgi:type III pantothenate kinase
MIKKDRMDLLLAIDIGNTTTDIGLFENRRFTRKVKISSKASALDVLKLIKRLCKPSDPCKARAIISSVAPVSLKNVEKVLKTGIGIRPIVVGRHVKVPIRNLYEKPLQVGQDRLVAAYACKQLYNVPAIIIDFGTAITFDLVNSKGEYEGGLITPGAGMALEALAEKTALLPKVSLKCPKRLIGKNTVESIRSGIINGLSGMCSALVSRLKCKKRESMFVLATGGLCRIMTKYSKCIDNIDENLILKGLCLIYYRKTSYKQLIR